MSGAPEAPKGTAADGKTELFNVPGYPLMVSAVDFNRLHAYCQELEAQVILDCMTHGQQSAEIEHVVGDVSKNGAESNMAQQPAPSAAAGYVIDLIGKLVQAESNKTRTHQEYMGKAMPDDVYGRFQRLRDETIPALRTQLLDALAALPQHSPTPQADSQPAPVEVADAMADSQYLAGVSAGWNAANADDPNAALQKLHESRAGYLKPLSAARAQADSVPTCASNAAETLTIPEECPHIIWFDDHEMRPAIFAGTGARKSALATFKKISVQWNAHLFVRVEKNSRDDRYPCASAQVADSVLEDAARLDWLDQNIFYREMDEWDAKHGGRGDCTMWVIFAPKGHQGSARNIIDAARKQGGAT